MRTLGEPLDGPRREPVAAPPGDARQHLVAGQAIGDEIAHSRATGHAVARRAERLDGQLDEARFNHDSPR